MKLKRKSIKETWGWHLLSFLGSSTQDSRDIVGCWVCKHNLQVQSTALCLHQCLTSMQGWGMKGFPLAEDQSLDVLHSLSKVKTGKRELMRKFSYWTTSQKTLYFYSWIWEKRGPRRGTHLYFLYLLFGVLHIYNFHRKICPLSLCYVILKNINFQLNHILPTIIKL